MGFFLILDWCVAILGRCRGPNIFPGSFRFGEINSGLGRCEFPLHATGIRRQGA